MRLVQPIFIVALIITAFVYLSYFRTSLADRLIALSIFFAGFLAVLFPDLTSSVARLVGVGRGVDLCLYLFSLATMFSLVMLYTKIARLERLNTELVRSIALQTAQPTRRNESSPGRAADS
jgi:hypothetical protein